jgi:hypothetical protein
MKRYGVLAVALFVAITTDVLAADDGNTKWRLNSANLPYQNSSTDVIATTNGAGNIKGVRCLNTSYNVTFSVYVNGGSAESFTFDPLVSDGGFIPFNIRFTSSVRVSISRGAGGSGYIDHICYVSWGLD